MLVRQTVTITTAADGSATVYSGKVTGKILYIDFGSGLAATTDITITGEDSSIAILTKANQDGAAAFTPKRVVNLNTDGSTIAQWEDIFVTEERLKIVIAQGGNAKTATVTILTDEP